MFSLSAVYSSRGTAASWVNSGSGAMVRRAKKTKKRAAEGDVTKLEARTRAAQQRRRAAKKQAKEARKLLKEAKRVAKRAKRELQALSKKLKALMGDAIGSAAKPPKRRRAARAS
jgi:hypothetical protein